MLIDLRQAQFTELTPAPPVTVMCPLTGRGHLGPAWLIGVNISIFRGCCHRTPGTNR